MKPSTKQNCEGGAKKKEANVNKSTSNIQKYFKNIPKSHAQAQRMENKNECEAARAMYINALKQKLEKFANEGDTPGDTLVTELEVTEEEVGVCIEAMKQPIEKYINTRNGQNMLPQTSAECNGCTEKSIENKMLENKYQEMKKKYLKLSVYCAELNLKYADLIKTKTPTIHDEIDDAATSSCDVFLPNEMKILRGISLEKKKDSTFIHQSLEYAYKNDLSVLRNKTLKGKSELVQISEDGERAYFPNKDPLTPKKVDRIRELFIERIDKCQIDPVNYGERIKDSYINRLFACSITNISKKHK